MLSGEYNVNTLYLFHHMSAKHHSFWHWGEFPQCSLYGGFLEGEWTKDYLAQAQLPHQKEIQKE